VKPLTQGDLDGTCGVYSLINTVDLLFPRIADKDRAATFKAVCMSIEERWPAVLWAGIGEMDMRRMLKAAQLHLKRSVSWEQPFRRRHLVNFEEFSRELRRRIMGDDAFAIVGTRKPWSHWTVAHRLTDHMMIMTDSCHVKQIPLAKCGLSGDGTDYEFDYKSTFTLMKGKANA
jgi:hypothetical protein